MSTYTEAKEVLIKLKVIKYKIVKGDSPKLDMLAHIIHSSLWKCAYFHTVKVIGFGNQRPVVRLRSRPQKVPPKSPRIKGFCSSTLRIKDWYNIWITVHMGRNLSMLFCINRIQSPSPRPKRQR